MTSEIIAAGPKHRTAALHVPPPGLPSNLVLQWLFPAWLLCQVQVARPDTDLSSAVVTLIGQFLTGPWLPNRWEDTGKYLYVHMNTEAHHCAIVVWKSNIW